MNEKIIDVCGLSCPEPVIIVKRELEKTCTGFKVITEQEVAKENISRLVKKMGYDIIVEEKESEYILIIKKDN
ncbi:MAG: sulfurtransferase TusA family protein [Bacillota bacterium]|nr:sulfurtransferase TusA family protein [Bacillota bacterium]